MNLLGATAGDAPIAFIELGAVAIVLAALARLAGRLGVPAIPFYLLAGLAVGEGGLVPLDVSSDFISLTAHIGVLLLLLALGLEYTGDELRNGLRTGAPAGIADALLNFAPGLACGLLLGWELIPSLLLGGVCWISSSAVVAKILDDFGWLANRETPAVLNLLVFEDLAMAVYLPVIGALVAGRAFDETAVSVVFALVAVAVIMTLALRYGDAMSGLLSGASDESLLLTIFGVTLLVGGLAEQVQVSAAIGAFLVGLALSGPVQRRAGALDWTAARSLRRNFLSVLLVSAAAVDAPRRRAARACPRIRRDRFQICKWLDRMPTSRHRTTRALARGCITRRPWRILDRHRESGGHHRERR